MPSRATIATLHIYPAIEISRVGGFNDGGEKIKTQVQRFRVYAFDDGDRVIGEITDERAVKCFVHLANTKTAWYGFNNPLDNGDAAPGLPGARRNQ